MQERGTDFLPAVEHERRTRLFRRRMKNLVFVTPSAWLAEQAVRRLPTGCRVETIPNSVDLDVFRPVADRMELRAALGLPRDRFVVLAGSQDLSDPRKGMGLLLDAVGGMAQSARDRMTLLLFGDRGQELAWASDRIHAGHVADERLLNLYYNAADLYILPSLADNLPNTLVESLSAGTPCMAFDVGGCPELVADGETGFLVRHASAEALSAAMAHAVLDGGVGLGPLRLRCRTFSEGKFSPALQAGRYVKLFRELVANVAQG